jgi:hypothetical protein
LPLAGPGGRCHDPAVRLTPIGVALLVTVAVAGALLPISLGASLMVAGLAGLVLVAAAVDAGGHAETDMLDVDVRAPARAAERKRSALARLKGDRGWDRRCPDAPDEPVDDIWARERRRRAVE